MSTPTPTPDSQTMLIDTANTLARLGYQLTPIGMNKAPAMPKGFMETPASEVTQIAIKELTAGAVHGLRVELGPRGAADADGAYSVLLAFEIEGKAPDDIDARLADAVAGLDAGGLIDILRRGWAESTPSGPAAERWFFRVTVTDRAAYSELISSLPTRRALINGVVVAELLTQSAIVAPSYGSTHPTGKPYGRLEGSEGPGAVPTLSVPEVRVLALLLDELSDAMTATQSDTHLPAKSPFARQIANSYRSVATAEETLRLLRLAGWRALPGALPDEVVLTRPGTGSNERHAAIGGTARPNGELSVYTTSDPTLPAGFYPAFSLLTLLEHGGDADAAALALVDQGVVAHRSKVLAAKKRRRVTPKRTESDRLQQQVVDAAISAINPRTYDEPMLLRKESASGEAMFLLTANPGAAPTLWDRDSFPSFLLAVVQPVDPTDKNPNQLGHSLPTAIVKAVLAHLMTSVGPARVVVTATEPTLLATGKVLATAGYYRADRVLISIPFRERAGWASGYIVPPVPTLIEAQCALDFIASEVMADFPFETAGDRARAVALLVTLCARHLMDRVPGFIIDAPDRGTGKSLWTELCRLIARGTTRATLISASKGDDEENRKQIVSALREGDACLHVDELPRGDKVTSKVLSEIITAADGSFRYRVLGGNSQMPVTGLTVTVAGNNVDPGADFNRRLFPIRLAYPDGIPHERQDFKHPHITRWVRENRPQLLAAVHTILLYGIQHPLKAPAVGSFEDWSRVVLGALQHVSLRPEASVTDDIMDGRSEWTASKDENAEDWGPFMAWVSTNFTDKWITAKEIRTTLAKARKTGPDLPSALRLAATESDAGANRAWGIALNKTRDVATPWGGVIHRLRVQLVKGGREASRYRVELQPLMSPPVPGGVDASAPAAPALVGRPPQKAAAAQLHAALPDRPVRDSRIKIKEISFK